MLKKKQAQTNDDWLVAVRHIRETVSQDEIEKAVLSAVSEIRQVTAGKNVAYAWSGGKDSIVLSKLCEMAGIHNSMFAHSELEYPEFLSWCMKHKPDGCTVMNVGPDLDWLAEHPEMLFPRKSRTVYRWYCIVQQKGIREYFREHKLDMMLVGHRNADGNHTGTTHIITNREGVTRYSPMARWPHEYILAAIEYYGLELPPIYGWKNGYRNGTHSWPCRLYVDSVKQGYQEVYEIDPSIVMKAAEKLGSARAFLREVSA